MYNSYTMAFPVYRLYTGKHHCITITYRYLLLTKSLYFGGCTANTFDVNRHHAVASAAAVILLCCSRRSSRKSFFQYLNKNTMFAMLYSTCFDMLLRLYYIGLERTIIMIISLKRPLATSTVTTFTCNNKHIQMYDISFVNIIQYIILKI